MIDNKLGDGDRAGEMAVISSQNSVTGLSAKNPWQTRLIAASLRNYNQLELLAEQNNLIMPPKVAAAGRKSQPGKFVSRMHENYRNGRLLDRCASQSRSNCPRSGKQR